MRYAQIRKLDVSNGIGIGVSLFVQGCRFHCKNCFNQDTWDFNGGKEWNDITEKHFLALVNRPYIERVSFLGGEPLANENCDTIYHLCSIIHKPIWLYTGYCFDCIQDRFKRVADVIVDGQYKDELRNMNLSFRGSSNQHIWKKDKDGHWMIIDKQLDNMF